MIGSGSMNPLVAPFLPGLSGTLGQQFTFARPPGRIRSRLALTPASPWPGPKKVHALTRPAASAPRGARSTTGIEAPKQWRILARRPGGQWFNADTPVLRTTLPNAKDGARKWLAGMPLGSCVGLIQVIDNPYLPAISNLAAISWTECSRATTGQTAWTRLSVR